MTEVLPVVGLVSGARVLSEDDDVKNILVVASCDVDHADMITDTSCVRHMNARDGSMEWREFPYPRGRSYRWSGIVTPARSDTFADSSICRVIVLVSRNRSLCLPWLFRRYRVRTRSTGRERARCSPWATTRHPTWFCSATVLRTTENPHA